MITSGLDTISLFMAMDGIDRRRDMSDENAMVLPSAAPEFDRDYTDDELTDALEDVTQTNLKVLWDDETKRWRKP